MGWLSLDQEWNCCGTVALDCGHFVLNLQVSLGFCEIIQWRRSFPLTKKEILWSWCGEDQENFYLYRETLAFTSWMNDRKAK